MSNKRSEFSRSLTPQKRVKVNPKVPIFQDTCKPFAFLAARVVLSGQQYK